MPSELNPFEPWRPRGGDGDEMHPWRAVRRDEPDPADDREVPHYQRRQGGGNDDAPARPPSTANFFLVVLFLVVVGLGLGFLAYHGGGHVGRIGATAACLFLGPLVGLSLLHRSSWYVRLGLLTVGVAGGVACWYFVPTLGGLSLWSAQEMLARLERLPAGDPEAYRATESDRALLRQEFPAWKADIARVEMRLMQNSINQLIAEADRLRQTDAEAALRKLSELEKLIASFPQQWTFQPSLNAALQRAADARLDQIAAEANALAKNDPLAAQRRAAELGQALRDRVASRGFPATLDNKLATIRRQLLDRHMAAARAALDRLVKEGKWDDVQREGRRWQADLLDAARPIGREADVAALVTPYRRNAIRQRMTEVVKSAEALVEKGDHEKAMASLRAAADAVRADAVVLNLDNELEQMYGPLMGRIVRSRIDEAGKSLQVLLEKKDYAAVATEGRKAHDALAEEAKARGEATRLNDRVTAVREKALLARLELARQEFRALLVKEQYDAIAKTAERSARDLGPEADLIGKAAELAKFTRGCEAIVKVAELAGKKK